MKWDKCNGNFNVARYFSFYTYQKMTICWKRKGPQVRGTDFSGLASLHFTSDYDLRNGHYLALMQQIFLERRTSVLLISQNTWSLNSKQLPWKLGTSGVAHHILTTFSLTNIISVSVKKMSTFKKLWFLYYKSDCKMFYII